MMILTPSLRCTARTHARTQAGCRLQAAGCRLQMPYSPILYPVPSLFSAGTEGRGGEGRGGEAARQAAGTGPYGQSVSQSVSQSLSLQ
jgi:hypothetical protein